MASIRNLKDNGGNVFYPLTHERAVKDSNGVTLETKLAELNSRPYNSQSPNGMGYLVLEKDKTFASQVTAANTIYEIRYDYDLNNASITIPAGCVLKFNGGKLENGTINFNDSVILADKEDYILNLDDFSGLYDMSVKWFGAKGDKVTDDTDVFQFLCNRSYPSTATILVPKGIYVVTGSINSLSNLNFRLVGERMGQIPYHTSFSNYDKKFGSIIYCPNEIANPLIYAPKEIGNISFLGKSNEDFASLYALRPAYSGTVCISMYNSGNYYSGANLHDIDVLFFGKGIHQGPGFGNRVRDLYLCKNKVAWHIEVNSLSITNLNLYNVQFELSETIGFWLQSTSSTNSRIKLYGCTCELSNYDGNNDYNDLRAEGSFVVSCFGCYIEPKDNTYAGIYSSSVINIYDCYLADGNYSVNRAFLSGVIAYGATVVCSSTSQVSIIRCYLYDVDYSQADEGALFIISSDITQKPRLGNISKAIIDGQGYYSESQLATMYSDFQNTPFIKVANTGEQTSLWVKAHGTVYKIPLHRGQIQPTVSGLGSEIINYKDNGKLQYTMFGQSFPVDAFGRYAALPDSGRYVPTSPNMLGPNIGGFQFFATDKNRPMFWSVGRSRFVDANGNTAASGINAIAVKGATSDRPSILDADDAGFTFFDKTLGKMIVWNGSAWVNMDGTALS